MALGLTVVIAGVVEGISDGIGLVTICGVGVTRGTGVGVGAGKLLETTTTFEGVGVASPTTRGRDGWANKFVDKNTKNANTKKVFIVI